jgi:hypothetical protein
MRRFFKNYIESNLFFWVFSLAALGLIVAGFLFPPPGQIDNSVLVGAGELNGTIALGCVLKAIDKGVDVTAQHNNTSISITNREEEDKKDKDEEEVG